MIEITDKYMYDECIRTVARMDAIIDQIESLDDVSEDCLSEDDINELVFKAADLISQAKSNIKRISNTYLHMMAIGDN